ncbi:hypothetical protein [Microbacterium sp. CGR1]|uniref:hypothetical protein n=1 Tax=Microbacterium sp. CGR1 TaxID=1696072 RepID=UPI003DA4FCE2
MARVAGRNVAISWIAGVLCTGVVGALIWFAIPIMPAVASLVGDTLRSTLP